MKKKLVILSIIVFSTFVTACTTTEPTTVTEPDTLDSSDNINIYPYSLKDGLVYYYSDPIEVVDVDSFEVVPFIINFERDGKKYSYQYTQVARDKDNLYIEGVKTLLNFDEIEFMPITETSETGHFIKDSNYLYFGPNLIENADPESFELFEPGFYAKDKNQAYIIANAKGSFTILKIPENIDLSTFLISYDGLTARDKSHVWRSAREVEFEGYEDWNEYVDEENGFGFKYPSELIQKDNSIWNETMLNGEEGSLQIPEMTIRISSEEMNEVIRRSAHFYTENFLQNNLESIKHPLNLDGIEFIEVPNMNDSGCNYYTQVNDKIVSMHSYRNCGYIPIYEMIFNFKAL